ncbi:MAG: hypothetical protein HYY24_04315 [Verrucomicrobia bacterium]|nr:hypothetical protein [Verrucomicrobiota bacterium]
MTKSRRYEILLPLRSEIGQPVAEELFSEMLLELENKFEAVAWDAKFLYGSVRHGPRFFRDDLMRAFTDVEDTAENRAFFTALKERVKERFQLSDVEITSSAKESE